MFVLIPAYQPTATLPALVRELRASDRGRGSLGLRILVVDDGSGPAYAQTFADAVAAGAELVRHERNEGKGRALKTGFLEIARHDPAAAVITADADGQHRCADIRHIGERLRAGVADLVLGERDFSGADVPRRSRFGNRAASLAFRLAGGGGLGDTQTGLRGLSARMLPWAVTVPGERFEYEMRMLVLARGAGFTIAEIPIETVYEEGNPTSHFRPVRDSLNVMLPLLAFPLSGLASAVLDTGALLGFTALTGNVMVSAVIARLLSGTVNFELNRRFVFHAPRKRGQLIAYFLLGLTLLIANAGLLQLAVTVGLPLLPAKLAIDVTLFIASWGVQRSRVFASTPPETLPENLPETAEMPAQPQAHRLIGTA